MITWLQNFFLKHNKVLFGGLLVVIIVTFVLTTGSQSIFGGGQSREIVQRDFFGYDLNNQNAQRALVTQAQLSAQLNPQLGLRGPQLMEYAYMRAAALGWAAQLGIGQPTEAQVETYVKSLPIFQNVETGEFDAERYTQMMDLMQANPQMDEATFARVIRDDWRAEQVREALGGPGYILPFAAEQEYTRARSTYDIILARFDYDTFSPELEPTPEELAGFYDRDPGRYAVPERLRTSAVFFNAEDFVGSVEEPTETDLDLYFERFKFRYREAPTPAAEGEEPVTPPEPVLADVRDRVISDWKLEQARRVAEESSEAFTIDVFEQSIAKGSDELTAAIDRLGGNLVTVPPYARGAAPANPSIPRQLFDSVWVFARSETRFVSDPGRNRDGAVVLLVEEIIPERQPELAEVESSVRTDYLAEERRSLFLSEGRVKQEAVASAVAGGSAFAAAAEEAGLTVDDREPFLGLEMPADMRGLPVTTNVLRLEVGAMTDFLADAQAGYIAFLETRTDPVETTEEGEDFDSYFSNLQEQAGNFEGWMALGELASRRMEELEPETETAEDEADAEAGE